MIKLEKYDEKEFKDKVIESLGFTGNDEIITSVNPHIEGVMFYVSGAGVSDEILMSNRSVAVVARGVSDIWNYESGRGTLSEFFKQMVTQLATFSKNAKEY